MNQPLQTGLRLLTAGGLTALRRLIHATRAAGQKAIPHPPSQIATGVQQGCAIPFRVEGNEVRVCLVSLSNQSGWGFPKGMVDAPETVAQAALREAFEEAGVRGSIVGEALGRYSYLKRAMQLDVTVFLMHVTSLETHWPEEHVRRRQLCSVSQARALIATAEQRQLLEVAAARLAELPVARR